MTSLQV